MGARESRQFALLPLAVTALVAPVGCGPAGVLGRIESYRAPPYPASEHIDCETYDYRLRDSSPVPPTPVDTLVFDIWRRVNTDTGAVPPPTAQDMAMGIEVYIERDWSQIAGFRPWTHWNFIRGLTPEEKGKLAEEVACHIGQFGVKDPDEPPDYLDSALVLAEREIEPGDDVHFTIVLKGGKGSKLLCLSHIRDRPQRWIYQSLVGTKTCSDSSELSDGDPYKGAPQFATLAENDTINVPGTLRIHSRPAEGDYELFVSIPHWPEGCALKMTETWPTGHEGCWLGQIISKPVPLKIASRAGPAEPLSGPTRQE
ncbi:MAG: hypothetical protein ACYS9X_32400 [Planctomycetota bacterium]|jgi:hypothetical protein